MVLISVSHASPMATSREGSCFHPSRSNLLPPQGVSCNDAANFIGCRCCTTLSYTQNHSYLFRFLIGAALLLWALLPQAAKPIVTMQHQLKYASLPAMLLRPGGAAFHAS